MSKLVMAKLYVSLVESQGGRRKKLGIRDLGSPVAPGS
jgi:hypothetical protein